MKYYHNKKRDAITVIEVLFAAGIAVFGLIGIASLISVAGRQASQSNAVSQSQAYANAWYADFVARGFNDSTRWRWYDDQAKVYKNFGTLPGAININSTTPPTSGTTVNSTRTRFRNAICIDPAFFAEATNGSEITKTFVAGQAFRPGLFPYYQDNFNPLTSPYNPTGGLGLLSVDLPRLLRVTLTDAASGSVIPANVANRLFLSLDDLAVYADEADRTLPATRLVGSNAASKGEFSWFATLSPREFSAAEILNGPTNSSLESLFTLSIVVLHRRDRQFFVPLSSASGPEEMPQGERLLSVSAPTPFVGGSGGRVELSATNEVSNKMRLGDWVMLTRHQSTAAGRSVVVRWFRIIGMDAEPTIGTVGWSRNVVLEGPDWDFSATSSFQTTQATLVNNVITVLERVIPVY